MEYMCRLKECLGDYIDDRLSTVEKNLMTMHLENCSECRMAYDIEMSLIVQLEHDSLIDNILDYILILDPMDCDIT